MRELRSQLQIEKTRVEEIWEELGDTEEALAEVRSELKAAQTKNSELEQKLAAASKDLPEAAEVYNQFKAANPKTKTTYKEVVDILARVQAMIEG